ncbi:MAG: c-type cytochrome [Pseudomonadota bacterium]
MTGENNKKFRSSATVLWAAAVCSCLAAASCSREGGDHGHKAHQDAPKNAAERVALKRARLADASTGRVLFIEKGCVVCHAVNEVGGSAATPLDAHVANSAGDPLEFAARMWRGAPAMIALQRAELGYSIDLTAEEIADLAAFAMDRREQSRISSDALPAPLRESLLDAPLWEMDDWDHILGLSKEGVGESEVEERVDPTE